MAKDIYYEIVDDDRTEPADGAPQSSEMLPSATTDGDIVPVRDHYRELIAAASKIDRARFRVVPDDKNNIAALTLVTFGIILAGCILLYISKNKIGSIVICSIMIVGVAVAVVAMIVNSINARKAYCCYYFKTDGGAVCISHVGNCATVYIASDKTYRIEGDNIFTLSCDAYIDFLDGEGAGIAAVLAAKEDDVELIDDGVYRVNNNVGGGHDVHIDDGKIVSIVSSQPYKTDVIDEKTGEAKIKTKLFEKTGMTDDFGVLLPDGVKQAFLSLGLNVDELIARL